MISTAYAMGQTGAQQGAAGGIAGFLPIIILFAIFYFLLIRPQQKKAKEQRTMIENLKKGDRILTSGGIYGTILSLDESTITLEIAEKVKIKMARNHVGLLLNKSNTETENNKKK